MFMSFASAEARRRADIRDLEQLDRILGRDDVDIAVAPAEPEQVIPHGGGGEAHLLRSIGDAERAVALRELGAVGPVDQRHMREARNLPPIAL